MRVSRFVPLLVFALLSLAGAGVAPAQQSLSILDDGKPPRQPVPVNQFLNGQKTLVATTDASGNVDIPLDELDFGKGEEVQVWVRRCQDGRVEVTLARAEEGDPNVAEHAQAGEDCRCERIDAFIWDGGPVDIDITRETVTQQPAAGPGPTRDAGLSWYGMVKYEHRYFYNWEDVSGDDPSVVSHDATSSSNGFGAFVGARLGDLPVWGMVGGYYAGGLETNSTLTDGTRIHGDVDNYALGGGVRALFNTSGRFNPFLWFAGFHSWNKGQFTTVDGATVSEDRTLKSWTSELGIGAVYWARPRIGIDFGLSHNGQFDSQNADENVRASVGVIYNGGRVCGGQCGGRR